MKTIVAALLLCSAVLIGCSRQNKLESDLHWHPSKISCPDDRWTPQNGYILQRIEGANGREWCMDSSQGVAYPPQAGAHSGALGKYDSENDLGKVYIPNRANPEAGKKWHDATFGKGK